MITDSEIAECKYGIILIAYSMQMRIIEECCYILNQSTKCYHSILTTLWITHRVLIV